MPGIDFVYWTGDNLSAFLQNPRSQSKESGGKLQITWDNPKDLEVYIAKLQSAAERLSTENRKLRKWHTDFIDKVVACCNILSSVILLNHWIQRQLTLISIFCNSGHISQVVTLMNVDLLRHQQRWKDGLQDLRTGFATLEAQVLITVRGIYVFAAGLHVIFYQHTFTEYIISIFTINIWRKQECSPRSSVVTAIIIVITWFRIIVVLITCTTNLNSLPWKTKACVCVYRESGLMICGHGVSTGTISYIRLLNTSTRQDWKLLTRICLKYT